MKRSPTRSSAVPDPDVLADWCRKLIESDHEAYTRIYRHLKSPLIAYARGYASNSSAADDIVHDVFVKLWRFRRFLRPDGSLKSYLYVMVKNEAINYWKKQRLQAVPIESVDQMFPASEPTGEEWLEYRLLSDRLQVIIESMPCRRKEAFLLSRRYGLSHEQIGRLMNLKPPVVNVYIVRALQDVRSSLAAQDRLKPAA